MNTSSVGLGIGGFTSDDHVFATSYGCTGSHRPAIPSLPSPPPAPLPPSLHRGTFPAALLQDLAARVAGDELALHPDMAKLAAVAARHDRHRDTRHRHLHVRTVRGARALGALAGNLSVWFVTASLVVDSLGFRLSGNGGYICTQGQEPSQDRTRRRRHALAAGILAAKFALPVVLRYL